METSYFNGNSIHDVNARCITLIGTHNLRIEKNFAYNHLGHCISLEDGIES